MGGHLNAENRVTESAAGSRYFTLVHLLLIGAEIVLAVVATLLVIRLVRERDDHVAVILGVCYGVISVAAAWLALGVQPWLMRLCGSVLTALAVLVSGVVGFAAIMGSEDFLGGLVVSGLAQFLLLQFPFWLLRWVWGLRLVHEGQLGPAAGRDRFQFSLWQMLLVMTLVAVALGIGRGVVELLGKFGGSRGMGGDDLIVFSLLVGYNLLLAWPLIWSVLSPGGAIWKTALALLLGAALTAFEMPVARALVGTGPSELFWLMNIPQVACLLAHLAVTRACGYRLVRWN